ncbi:MAG: bifunctional oligoribonuclease/PAP phosphatase NrnA [Acidobacteriaceae bacterium]
MTSHARPDGDAVGSVIACTLLLRAMGKQADPMLADPVPLIYKSLPHAGEIIPGTWVERSYDAAIILECDNVQRTQIDGIEKTGSGIPILINIDHHRSTREFGHINWIDPTASAVAQMVFELAAAAGVTVNSEMATCLYAAVLTDTGSFCFEGTNHRTFALAEELVRRGADPVRIAQNIYFARPASKVRLMGSAFCNLHRDGALAWMHVTHANMLAAGALEEDCEGLVNFALGIAGVELAAFFRELPDGRFRVSLRSKGAINVAGVAEQFGGGGHECAAGLALDGPLEVAKEQVLDRLLQAPPRTISQH